MAAQLRANGQKVALIIATDGEPRCGTFWHCCFDIVAFLRCMFFVSDGNIIEAMRPLHDLPVWVVLRLCTDDDRIGNYWSDVDRQVIHAQLFLSSVSSWRFHTCTHLWWRSWQCTAGTAHGRRGRPRRRSHRGPSIVHTLLSAPCFLPLLTAIAVAAASAPVCAVRQVHKVNRWLTYGEPLQRLREFGVTMKEVVRTLPVFPPSPRPCTSPSPSPHHTT